MPEGAVGLKGGWLDGARTTVEVDLGKTPKSDTPAPLRLTLESGNCAGWRGVRVDRISRMAMSKTVAAGFQTRTKHFITAGTGARLTGGRTSAGQGREGTIRGAKETEDRGREWWGWELRKPSVSGF